MFKSIKDKEWPRWSQWKQLPRILNNQERWIVRGLFLIIVLCLGLLIYHYCLDNSYLIPEAGGCYREGILGQPRYINPVLSQTNDADRDLVQLIYSSLFKYNGQGRLVNDLVDSYTIEDEGLTYQISLKKNVRWHDGQPLTADDVIFTIELIKDPEYNSPLRNNWQNVETEKIDNFNFRLKIKSVYAPFLHNLTFGVLPKHLWQEISPANFTLAEYDLKPIGSGPYKFKELSKVKNGKINSIELVRNEEFYLDKPYIESLILKFYNSQQELVEAYQRKQIDGLSTVSVSHLEELNNNFTLHQINLPIYYAIFFNQNKSKALADKTVRLALAYATDKQNIIDQVLAGYGQSIDSPLLPGCLGYKEDVKVYDFALEHANNILEADGWSDEDGDGVREKEIKEETVKLEINLVASDWPEIEASAKLIQEQWQKVGARVNLQIVDSLALQQDYLRPREYQALLFGEALGADPDPFAFWHSSHRKDPGLNIALYQNKDVDKLLEEARQNLDSEARSEKYREFQELLVEDVPAVFLFSPTYLYPVNHKVQGIQLEKISIHSYRFSQIENWYIKTNRVWK